MKKIHALFLILALPAILITKETKAQDGGHWGLGVTWWSDNFAGIDVRAAFPLNNDNLFIGVDGVAYVFGNYAGSMPIELNGNIYWTVLNEGIMIDLLAGLNFWIVGDRSSPLNLNLGGNIAIDQGSWAPFLEIRWLPLDRGWSAATLGAKFYF